ncbi:hypothetical protein ACSZOJ_09155 [Aeromonas dhakensis]
MSGFFDYKNLLTDELEHRYESVLSFSDRPQCSSIEKALIKFNILGYTKVAAKRYSAEIFDAIADKLSGIAEIIIVKGTCISPCLIDKVKKLSPKTRVICYSWDSISNIKTFPLLAIKADAAYTFDIADCKKYGYGYLPLFYSDKKNHSHAVAKEYKYSFIGSYHGDRVAVLQRIFSHEHDASTYVKIFFRVNCNLHFTIFLILPCALRQRSGSHSSHWQGQQLLMWLSRANMLSTYIMPIKLASPCVLGKPWVMVIN